MTALVGIPLFNTSNPEDQLAVFLPARELCQLIRRPDLSNSMLLTSPKVLSSKDIAKSPVDFKMYDAIPASQQSLSTEDSSEINKFLPMLNDYLKSEVANITSFGTAFNERIVHDIDVGSEMNPPAVKKPGQPILPESALDGDYVWDVFYHRPATLSEWIEAANVGTLWVTSLSLPQTCLPHRLFQNWTSTFFRSCL